MIDDLLESRRARLDYLRRTDLSQENGEFHRPVIRRPAALTRFQRWMLRPWNSP